MGGKRQSPNNSAFVFGRVILENDSDLATAYAFSKQIQLQPLIDWKPNKWIDKKVRPQWDAADLTFALGSSSVCSSVTDEVYWTWSCAPGQTAEPCGLGSR